MDALILGAAGLMVVAAITPGPNNLVVMRTAAQSGFVAAMPAIAGIVAGSLAMFVLAMAGMGAVFAREPRLHLAVAVAGGAYLCWLGARLVLGSFAAPGKASPAPALPTGTRSLFAFQFVNPKGWVMVLTVTAAVNGAEVSHAAWQLAALYAGIPALCLSLWSALGTSMARAMAHASVRAWLDRVLGVVLIAAALLFLFAPKELPA